MDFDFQSQLLRPQLKHCQVSPSQTSSRNGALLVYAGVWVPIYINAVRIKIMPHAKS